MKRSVVTVLVAIGGAVAVLFASAVFIRFTAPPAEALPTLSGERTTRTHNLASFTAVEVRGQWQVTVIRGDAWGVELGYPIELERFIEVRKDGDKLLLGYTARRFWWSDFGSNEKLGMSARIVMPALEALDLSGASRVDFSGFVGPELQIEASGAVVIEGRDSRYDALNLSMSGAGSTDLSDVATTDADVTLSGANSATLRMAGGRLSGHTSGTNKIEYSGTVVSQDVSSSGTGSVQYRE